MLRDTLARIRRRHGARRASVRQVHRRVWVVAVEVPGRGRVEVGHGPVRWAALWRALRARPVADPGLLLELPDA